MEEILRFEHVSYAYEEEREALLDVCVKVCAGERVAVLGSNGAGKSTLIKIISGYHKQDKGGIIKVDGVLRPGAGRILFRGAPVGGGAKQLNVLRRGVGLVFQDPEVQLLGGSVEEEVSFGPMNLRLPVGEVRARVDTAIRSFALEEYRGRAPQYLSGGEKKRVTLADALAMEPQMLLLDEPAASLDPANTRLLEQNLQMLSEQGLGLMVATHDVDFAWRWATRVLVFRGGRLAGDGEPREIFENGKVTNFRGDIKMFLCCGHAGWSSRCCTAWGACWALPRRRTLWRNWNRSGNHETGFAGRQLRHERAAREAGYRGGGTRACRRGAGACVLPRVHQPDDPPHPGRTGRARVRPARGAGGACGRGGGGCGGAAHPSAVRL